eukprot:12723895-Ditylum_brightwellii.AAC.1
MEPILKTIPHILFSMLCNFIKHIFEELIDSGIPADTMLQPKSIPFTIPASTTAASTRLPHAHINRVFTPNIGHPKQYNHR